MNFRWKLANDGHEKITNFEKKIAIFILFFLKNGKWKFHKLYCFIFYFVSLIRTFQT